MRRACWPLPTASSPAGCQAARVRMRSQLARSISCSPKVHDSRPLPTSNCADCACNQDPRAPNKIMTFIVGPPEAFVACARLRPKWARANRRPHARARNLICQLEPKGNSDLVCSCCHCVRFRRARLGRKRDISSVRSVSFDWPTGRPPLMANNDNNNHARESGPGAFGCSFSGALCGLQARARLTIRLGSHDSGTSTQ